MTSERDDAVLLKLANSHLGESEAGSLAELWEPERLSAFLRSITLTPDDADEETRVARMRDLVWNLAVHYKVTPVASLREVPFDEMMGFFVNLFSEVEERIPDALACAPIGIKSSWFDRKPLVTVIAALCAYQTKDSEDETDLAIPSTLSEFMTLDDPTALVRSCYEFSSTRWPDAIELSLLPSVEETCVSTKALLIYLSCLRRVKEDILEDSAVKGKMRFVGIVDDVPGTSVYLGRLRLFLGEGTTDHSVRYDDLSGCECEGIEEDGVVRWIYHLQEYWGQREYTLVFKGENERGEEFGELLIGAMEAGAMTTAGGQQGRQGVSLSAGGGQKVDAAEIEALEGKHTAEVAQLRKSHNATLAKLKVAHALLIKRLSGDRKRIAEERDKLQELVSKASAAGEDDVDALRVTHGKLQHDLVDAKRDLAKLQEEKAAMQETLASLGESLTVEKKHLVDSRASVDALSGKLTEVESDRESIKVSLADREAELAAIRDEHEKAMVAKSAELEAKIQEKTVEIDALQAKLSTVTDRLETTSGELQSTKADLELKVTALQKLRVVRKKLRTFKGDFDSFKVDVTKNLQVMREMARLAATKGVKQLCDQIDEVYRKYRKESAMRRIYFNQVINLKGKIRVYVRVRPPLPEDETQFEGMAVTCADDGPKVLVQSSERARPQEFEYDQVFGPTSTQVEIFEDIEPLATSVLDGYNVCIFAYGQTGSGKTYTMEGPPELADENKGLNFRVAEEMFSIIRRDRVDDYSYTASVSITEVYNDTLYDLLADIRTPCHILLSGDDVVVEGVTKVPIDRLEGMVEQLKRAQTIRATASTNMNEHSSRSHCIVSVYIEGENHISNEQFHGKLHLIDLAGSERLKKTMIDGDADRLAEGAQINKSLTTLGRVLRALETKEQHIPFRDCALTSYLKDSLSGNAKVLTCVCLNPIFECGEETLNSCQFGAGVKNVDIGKVKRNVRERGGRAGRGRRRRRRN